jgi:hypothetical protein
MTTSAPPLKKVVVPCGPHDYDAFLDDEYIGSFRTASQAQAELDRVAYEVARHAFGALGQTRNTSQEDSAAADPLAPFGTAGGPHPDVPVADAELDRAFEVLVSFYERSPAITSRAERALAIAKDRTHFTIRTDGSVTVQGSKRYQVTDQGCTCKDFFVRDTVHAGMCKHTIARELWRLAQAMRTAAGGQTSTAASQWAFCTLPSTTLGRALKKVLNNTEHPEAITLCVTYRAFSIRAGAACIAHIVADDGCGVRALTIHIDVFTALSAAYAAFLKPLGREAIPIQVFVDHDTTSIALLADGFAYEVSGTPE